VIVLRLDREVAAVPPTGLLAATLSGRTFVSVTVRPVLVPVRDLFEHGPAATKTPKMNRKADGACVFGSVQCDRIFLPRTLSHVPIVLTGRISRGMIEHDGVRDSCECCP
jgi:hypothetical protein